MSSARRRNAPQAQPDAGIQDTRLGNIEPQPADRLLRHDNIAIPVERYDDTPNVPGALESSALELPLMAPRDSNAEVMQDQGAKRSVAPSPSEAREIDAVQKQKNLTPKAKKSKKCNREGNITDSPAKDKPDVLPKASSRALMSRLSIQLPMIIC